jgi:aryl-alcohol dehydrogenase-like predicted oxidoreductase
VTLRSLGVSGPAVSVLGLGCNNFGRRLDLEASGAVVRAALDVGVNHFDTANVYGGGASEEYLGAALRGVRDQVVIATKVGIRRDVPSGGLSQERILADCEASLRRLGTDWIDVYYLHKPDPSTPRDETLAALELLIQQGKVRYVACSNHPAWQVTDLWHLAARGTHPPFVAVQLGLSLLDRSAHDDLLPACRELGVGAVVFSPLASGLLTGKYGRQGVFPAGSRLAEMPDFADVATSENLGAADDVRQIAEQRGVHPTALALSWVAAQPGVSSVLAGASSPEQVRQNAEDINHILDPDVAEQLDRLFDSYAQEDQ